MAASFPAPGGADRLTGRPRPSPPRAPFQAAPTGRRGEALRAGVRQIHRQPPGVQELTIETIALRDLSSIHRVTNDRESREREMDADLMRTTGERPDMEERAPFGPAPVGGDAREPRRRIASAG